LVRNRTADLHRVNEQLTEEIDVRRRMEREILEISSREKTRIGQDLHDTLGQELAGINFLVTALERKLRAAGAREVESTRQIGELLSHAMLQGRRIARGLSPVDTLAEGLVSSLDRLARDTSEMFGIECRMNEGAVCPIEDHEVANHLYHIVQESISNAVRHGKPTKIRIGLFDEGDEGRLEVEDNGTGFAADRPSGQGLGLHIMQYRAEAVGGEVSVGRSADGGVKVACRFRKRRMPERIGAQP
jgi:signal transduction histidine kinase